MSASLVGNLIIALLLITLLYYGLMALPFFAPYGQFISIACLILGVIVLILAFTGRNPINWVMLDQVRMLA